MNTSHAKTPAAVLWDFGGVILTSPFEAFNRYEAEAGLPKDFIRTVNARNGDTNLVDMEIENLPHGIIVSDIGLNGVQIAAGETERKIFLHCARWVPETDRLCHVLHRSGPAKAGEGKPTSLPVLLKVRQNTAQAAK